MKTFRNLAGLAFVIVVSMFGGVGCIAETDQEVDGEINAEYETQDLETESDTDSQELVEDEDDSTNGQDGVCGPPCTKI